jgi:hypothetical protein
VKIFNFLSTTRVLAEVQVESSRARAHEDLLIAQLSVESDERTDLLEKLAGDLKYKRIAPELVSRLATMVAEGSCPLKLGETIIGIYGSDSIEDSMMLIESAK